MELIDKWDEHQGHREAKNTIKKKSTVINSQAANIKSEREEKIISCLKSWIKSDKKPEIEELTF